MLDDDAAFDPLDPEVQRRMMEEFRLRAVDENLRQALEHTPEAFGSIWMLYVPTAVNGVKINAFVDSGAQMTIMSEFMAEKCNLTRLIDRRHQGVAKGVGESKITGVVHLATVQMGGVFLPMRITILESKGMDFLIGLDQLRRHQMCIDMRACVLRLDDKTAIPFLSEPEIEEMKQRHALEEAQSERLRDQNRVEEEKVRAARPQRSPQHGPATAGSSDAAASGNTATTPPALTDEQNEKVNTLVGAFGVPPGVARSALEAAQWDADSAVTFLGL
jgi:DNA damage-inducible protein 1